MRVITGSARGLPLRAPPGQATRPTSDMVKGMIFSMVAPAGPFERVADLYAGSGALGIEALSRGAAWASFVDRLPRACQTIRQNLRAAKLESAAEVFCAALPEGLRRLSGRYDLVVLDPPYGDPALEKTLARLAEGSLLAPGALVVAEHAATTDLPASIGSLKMWKQRRQGDSAVTLYVFELERPAGAQAEVQEQEDGDVG